MIRSTTLTAILAAATLASAQPPAATAPRQEQSQGQVLLHRGEDQPTQPATRRPWVGQIALISRRTSIAKKSPAWSTASASIIACLPISVMLLVYLTSPQYIELLWTHPMGRMMLACCVCWMSIGVMVMKKMINFDF